MNPTITISSVLAVLAVVLGGGVGVSLAAQLIKRVFGLNSSQVIHLMVVAVAIVASAAQYMLQLKNLPPAVLGLTAPAIYGFSQGVYNEAKIVGGFLSQVRAYTAAQKQAAAADAGVKAVTAPTDAQLAPETATNTGFDA